MTDGATVRDRVVIHPSLLVRKPVLRGTRISIELISRHLAQNRTLTMSSRRTLTLDDVRACLEYAHAVIEGEQVFPEARIGVQHG